MPYESALSTLAEVAVAIAGFSGIVSVFGRRSAGQWTTAERNRMLALLVLSLTALLFCLLPFVLLAIPVSESTCWRSLSLVAVVPRVAFLARLLPVAVEASRLARREREVSLVVSASFLVGDLLVIAALLANGLALGVAWPYLAMILWVLAEASVSFARLVLVPVQRGAAA